MTIMCPDGTASPSCLTLVRYPTVSCLHNTSPVHKRPNTSVVSYQIPDLPDLQFRVLSIHASIPSAPGCATYITEYLYTLNGELHQLPPSHSRPLRDIPARLHAVQPLCNLFETCGRVPSCCGQDWPPHSINYGEARSLRAISHWNVCECSNFLIRHTAFMLCKQLLLVWHQFLHANYSVST